MDKEMQEHIVFQGINQKPPSPPDWLYLLRHSSYYGVWGSKSVEDGRRKRQRGKRRRKWHEK